MAFLNRFPPDSSIGRHIAALASLHPGRRHDWLLRLAGQMAAVGVPRDTTAATLIELCRRHRVLDQPRSDGSRPADGVEDIVEYCFAGPGGSALPQLPDPDAILIAHAIG